MFWQSKKAVTVNGEKPAPVAASQHGVVVGNNRGRLIFSLDATASRQPTWDQACAVQSTMFDVAAELGGLDVKLVFYRGVQTCKASSWTSDSKQLHSWMNSVSCEGGSTQIARVLTHALTMAKTSRVNALVFVGDAMEEDPGVLFELAKELGTLRVPIIIFQEGTDAGASSTFKRMAKLSGGAHLNFDLANVHRLRELLGAVAAYASGGHSALLAHGRRSNNAEVLRLTSQLSG
ncbi:MAG TPA: hypothetical protein V6C81_21655 [Planktothrix sp.]